MLRILTSLLLTAACVRAAYPDFTSTKPFGGQIGSEFQLTIGGNRLDDFEDLMFYTPGFKVTKVLSRTTN